MQLSTNTECNWYKVHDILRTQKACESDVSSIQKHFRGITLPISIGIMEVLSWFKVKIYKVPPRQLAPKMGL